MAVKKKEELKFLELQTLYSLVEVQVTSITLLIESSNNEDQIKLYKTELAKLKPLKTKLNKIINDY